MTGQQLKNSILQLAVQGKLVPQDPTDEPASVLLARIREEKEQLIREKKIKRERNPSQIFRGDDGHFYERVGKNEPVCIDEELPFEIPKGWEWARLGGLAFVTKLAGFEYTKYIAPNLITNGIPLFKGKNIQNGQLILDFESYIDEKISDELSRSQLTKKCLLTPYVGTIGNIAIFPGTFKAHLGSNVGKIELYNSIKEQYVSEEYILAFLKSLAGYDQLTKQKKSTAQESISIQAIREVFIPLPPLAEQQRIVAKIDELMPFVDRYNELEKQLEALNTDFPDQLKKSILQYAIQGKLVPQDPADEPASALLERIRAEREQLIKDGKIKKEKNPSTIYRGEDGHFYERIGNAEPVCINEKLPFEIPEGWEWARLGTLYNFIDYRGSTPTKISSGVPLVTAKNVKKGFIDHSIEEYISEKEYSQRQSRGISRKGDILFTTEAPLGNAALADLSTFSAGQRLITFQQYGNSVNLSNTLMVYYILSDCFQSQLSDQSTGTTVKGIKASKLKQLLLPLPPLAEQQRIVEKLEQILSLCEHLTERV